MESPQYPRKPNPTQLFHAAVANVQTQGMASNGLPWASPPLLYASTPAPTQWPCNSYTGATTYDSIYGMSITYHAGNGGQRFFLNGGQGFSPSGPSNTPTPLPEQHDNRLHTAHLPTNISSLPSNVLSDVPTNLCTPTEQSAHWPRPADMSPSATPMHGYTEGAGCPNNAATPSPSTSESTSRDQSTSDLASVVSDDEWLTRFDSQEAPTAKATVATESAEIPPQLLYRCTYDNCPVRYGTREDLRHHKTDEHAGQNHKQSGPFQCDIVENGTRCDTDFASDTNLLRHVTNFHDKPNYPCEMCGAEFGRSDRLLKHRIEEHEYKPQKRRRGGQPRQRRRGATGGVRVHGATA